MRGGEGQILRLSLRLTRDVGGWDLWGGRPWLVPQGARVLWRNTVGKCCIAISPRFQRRSFSMRRKRRQWMDFVRFWLKETCFQRGKMITILCWGIVISLYFQLCDGKLCCSLMIWKVKKKSNFFWWTETWGQLFCSIFCVDFMGIFSIINNNSLANGFKALTIISTSSICLG